MKIHRSRPESGFVQIPNETVRDPRLSYLARGVLAEILSRPDDWRETADSIWHRARNERGKAGESRAIMRAAFTELAEAGYLHRQVRSRGRNALATDLHVFDAAQALDDNGTPVYFTLLADLAADVPAGRIGDRNDGPRTDLGKPASSQVVSTYRVSGAEYSGVETSGADTPVVITKTEDEELSTNTDHEHHSTDEQHPGVLISPVQVEGNGAAPVQDLDEYAADRQVLARLSGEHQSEALEAAMAGLPAGCTTRELVHRAAELVRLAEGVGRDFTGAS